MGGRRIVPPTPFHSSVSFIGRVPLSILFREGPCSNSFPAFLILHSYAYTKHRDS